MNPMKTIKQMSAAANYDNPIPSILANEKVTQYGGTISIEARPLTPDDVTREADRNYDLGRKHAKDEVAELTIKPMKAALEGLLLAASKLRIRVNHHAPNLVKFSEWDELTEAMRTGERVVKSSNDQAEARRPGQPKP